MKWCFFWKVGGWVGTRLYAFLLFFKWSVCEWNACIHLKSFSWPVRKWNACIHLKSFSWPVRKWNACIHLKSFSWPVRKWNACSHLKECKWTANFPPGPALHPQWRSTWPHQTLLPPLATSSHRWPAPTSVSAYRPWPRSVGVFLVRIT